MKSRQENIVGQPLYDQYWIERELEAVKSEEEIFSLDSSIPPTTPAGLRAWNLRRKHKDYLSKRKQKLMAALVVRSAPKDLDKEINIIKNEIAKIYSISFQQLALSEENFFQKSLLVKFPRLEFLLAKQAYLEEQQRKINQAIASLPTDGEEEENKEKKVDPSIGIVVPRLIVKKRHNTLPLILFNIFKKVIDVVDDAWSALKGVLPAKIVAQLGSYIVAGAGLIVHAGEAYQASKDLFHLIKDKNIGQRKSRMSISVITLVLTGTGVGLSLALIAGAIGATVAGLGFLPVLIPGLLLGVYGTSLTRKVYTLVRNKEEEAKAKEDFESYLSDSQHQTAICLIKNKLHDLYQQKQLCQSKLLSASKKYGKESLIYKVTLTQYQEIEKNIAGLDSQFNEIQTEMHRREAVYQHWKKEHLKAERELAFGALEVIATSIVLAGTIVSTAAVVALLTFGSIASFGALPIALLITGVAIGVAVKIFEAVDDLTDNKITARIRNAFASSFTKIKNKLGYTQKPTLQTVAANGKKPISMNEKQSTTNEDVKNQLTQCSTPINFSTMPSKKSAPNSNYALTQFASTANNKRKSSQVETKTCLANNQATVFYVSKTSGDLEPGSKKARYTQAQTVLPSSPVAPRPSSFGVF